MTYFEQLPNEKLSSYIQTFWYCQGNDVVNAVLTIPLLRHEMVFNFADAYSISNHLKAEHGLTHATWISGIQTKPTFSTSSGKHEMVGVLFKADGLHAFIKHHSSDFTNHHVDASLIFGNSLADLLCEMHNAIGGKSKITSLELFLLQHMKNLTYPAYLNASLKQFSKASDHKTSIKDTCNQAFTSNKSLINSFHKYIGINPKKYLQLQSINEAIGLLCTTPKQSLTRLAHHLNFYDQAHFIHSFQSVTGISPTEYVNAVKEGRVDNQTPNFVFLKG